MQSILEKLRRFFDDIASDPQTRARNEAQALQSACCGLYLEVARLDSPAVDRKRRAVTASMQSQFGASAQEIASMIENLDLTENRLTSYFRPVKLINKSCSPGQKVQIVERLWHIALADGEIDVYEDEVIRKISDLLYVAHADFILAKHRVRCAEESPVTRVAPACPA